MKFVKLKQVKIYFKKFQAFAPELIQRASITVSGVKNVREGGPFGQPQILDVYNFRARWFEPGSWHDAGFNEEGRVYHLQCWIDQNGLVVKSLTDIRINGLFSGYNEKYQFPPNTDLFMQCRVRAINAAGIEGEWRLTNRVRILDVPVFFPGIDVDLKGISNEEFLRILNRAAQKAGPDTDSTT